MKNSLPGAPVPALSETGLTQQVNSAFKNYHSTLALSRSPLANSALILPALVLDKVSPTGDEKANALRLVLQWAVARLAPESPTYPLGSHRPFDDPTWQDPRWWRYNILRHRYLEPLHPDDFVEGGRYTETLLALTGIPTPDAFFDERNRAIREVAQWLRRQWIDGEGNETLQRLALAEVLRPLQSHPTALALLGIASVFSDVFPRSLLLQMADAEGIVDAAGALVYLTTRRYLLTGDEGTALWLSPVLQAHTYDRQPKPQLRRRHHQVADYYEAEGNLLAAARHRQQAEEWTRAAAILLGAADALIDELQIGELRDALAQFERETLPVDQWRAVQILLADLWRMGGDVQNALAACRRALQAAPEAADQARIYRRMGKLYEQRNPLHALNYYRQAAERFAPSDPELRILLRDRAWLYIARQEWAAAERDLTFALTHTPADHRQERADLYDALASLYYYQGQVDDAIHYAQDVLAMREALGDARRVAASHNNLGMFYAKLGEYEHALAAYREALATYRRLGNEALIATAQLNIGMAHHFAGRLREAVAAYGESLTLCHQIGLPAVEAKVHSNLAEAFAELGEDEQARRHWRRGYALSRSADLGDVDYFLELRRNFPALQQIEIEEASDGDPTPAPVPDLEPDETTALEIATQSGQVTPRTLMEAAGISKATATRRLRDLVERGYLERCGKGRGTYYALVPSSPHQISEMHDPSAREHVLDRLRDYLARRGNRLAVTYSVDAVGILQAPENAQTPLRLLVRFSAMPSLPQFFQLESHLSTVCGQWIDLVPAFIATEQTTDDIEAGATITRSIDPRHRDEALAATAWISLSST